MKRGPGKGTRKKINFKMDYSEKLLNLIKNILLFDPLGNSFVLILVCSDGNIFLLLLHAYYIMRVEFLHEYVTK